MTAVITTKIGDIKVNEHFTKEATAVAFVHVPDTRTDVHYKNITLPVSVGRNKVNYGIESCYIT